MEYRKFPQGYVMRLDPGEEIVEQLTALVERENVRLGSVSGDYEISALVGNVSRKEGEPYLHLHITIGNPVTGEVHAGHLTSAVISATLELFLQVWDGDVDRRFSDTVGLNLFEF